MYESSVLYVVTVPNYFGPDFLVNVVPPPQESMDYDSSLFDYGLDNLYNDLIDYFDPYLEYGEGYQNRTAFKDAFYG